MSFSLSCLLFLIYVNLGYSTFTDCGGAFKYNYIKVNDCEGPESCKLIRGKNSTLQISFKPDREVYKVMTKVYGKIASVTIPFPIPEDDGCKDSGLSCPLQSDIEYTYTMTIPVRKLYPQITLKILWELYGDDQLIICSLFDAVLI